MVAHPLLALENLSLIQALRLAFDAFGDSSFILAFTSYVLWFFVLGLPAESELLDFFALAGLFRKLRWLQLFVGSLQIWGRFLDWGTLFLLFLLAQFISILPRSYQIFASLLIHLISLLLRMVDLDLILLQIFHIFIIIKNDVVDVR